MVRKVDGPKVDGRPKHPEFRRPLTPGPDESSSFGMRSLSDHDTSRAGSAPAAKAPHGGCRRGDPAKLGRPRSSSRSPLPAGATAPATRNLQYGRVGDPERALRRGRRRSAPRLPALTGGCSAGSFGAALARMNGFRNVNSYLEWMRSVRPDRKQQLHEHFVGVLPLRVARPAPLAADLAELARPVRQQQRRPLVHQQTLVRAT
jgi:hypothetical protein